MQLYTSAKLTSGTQWRSSVPWYNAINALTYAAAMFFKGPSIAHWPRWPTAPFSFARLRVASSLKYRAPYTRIAIGISACSSFDLVASAAFSSAFWPITPHIRFRSWSLHWGIGVAIIGSTTISFLFVNLSDLIIERHWKNEYEHFKKANTS